LLSATQRFVENVGLGSDDRCGSLCRHLPALGSEGFKKSKKGV
jgi:hypothetical protein